jgi:hypothetical protein
MFTLLALFTLSECAGRNGGSLEGSCRSERAKISVPLRRKVLETMTRQMFSNPFRMIFFAHLHTLSPMFSYSYKNRGWGWVQADAQIRATWVCGRPAPRTCSNSRISNAFMGLHALLWTPPG